jgi:hypothetical protein
MSPTCPDCGAEIAAHASVCPRCGFPLHAPGGRSSRSKAAGIIMGLVVCFFMIFFVGGFVAALAIPRFAMAGRRAKQQEAELMLRQLYRLEQSQLAQEGGYTAEVERLAFAADPGAPRRYYDPRVSRAEGKQLCLEAVPRAGSGVGAFSMDEHGWLFVGAGCVNAGKHAPGGAGTTVDTVTSYTAVAVPESEVRSGPGVAAARELLGQVYQAIDEYHQESGRYPDQMTDLLTHVHGSAATGEFEVQKAPGIGFCVAAVPHDYSRGTGEFSVDQAGAFYPNGLCAGEPTEHFHAQAGTKGSAGR